MGEDSGCRGLGRQEHSPPPPRCLVTTLLIPEGWSCIARGQWSCRASGRLQGHLDLCVKHAGVGILVSFNLE